LRLQSFNLLVGCPRERERAARSETQYFIGDLLEDPSLIIAATPGSGLLTCLTTLDPFQVVYRLREFADENPYQFRFAVRFTPMEKCVPSTVEGFVNAVVELRDKIEAGESFRVTVRRRRSELDTMHVVRSVAETISRKVNLERPDKTVWIEIIGELSGVSILVTERDILSIRAMQDGMH
jgi:tRNA acetyltransferase TAN1